MSMRALGLYIGLTLVHNGRRIRLEKDLGDWVLGFVDVETGYDYLVYSDVCDVPIRTTIDWIFEEKEAGRLIDPEEGADIDGRRRTFLGLDRAACIARDKKSAWRFRWAWAVLQDGPRTTSDNSYNVWMESRPDLLKSEEGIPECYPTPPTLRRWVRKLKAANGRRGALVSCSGRLKGKSPMPAFEDFLVHEAALYYWSAEGAKIVDAGGYYIDMRDAIEAGDDDELKKRLGSEPVRLETIRTRIRHLEGHAATEAKEGARQARRKFEAAGEGVNVERFLERVEVDGLELRQIVHYSSDWRVPSGKMKLINAIDAFTHFWWFPSIFCGPYREDMTAAAMMNVMMPPSHLPPEELEKNPWFAEAWGSPDTIVPDNERALFSPGAISALTELGPDFELPKANHPDGKPLVETLNRYIKGRLEGEPGTVRGPRHPKDPTRNAIKEAELTRETLRAKIFYIWLEWNLRPRDYLGGRSPLQMVAECITANDRPKRNTPGDVRRGLSKTHDNIIVTRDGFEFDGIVYQSPELAGLLDANYHRTGFKDRVSGSSKVIVSIRTNEADLHEAEVYDEQRKRFVSAFSTQPAYTKHLSRWEHDEYKRMMATEKPRRQSEVEKMRLRATGLRRAASDLPKASMKTAAKLAALLERDEIRRASGARAHAPDFNAANIHGLLATTGGGSRMDVPKPVAIPASQRGTRYPAPSKEFLDALGSGIATQLRIPDEMLEDEEPEDFAWPDLHDDAETDDDLDLGVEDDEE